MISLRATLTDTAPSSGKSGAPFFAEAAMPAPTEEKSAVPGSFASLLGIGKTDLAAQTSSTAKLPQNGKILPDGNTPGKILPLGADAAPDGPLAAEMAIPEVIQAAAEHPSEGQAIEVNAIVLSVAPAAGLAAQVPETEPPQPLAAQPAQPAKAAAKTPPSTNAPVPMGPAAALQIQASPQAESMKRTAQAAQLPAFAAVQTAQQAKIGASPARRAEGKTEQPASPSPAPTPPTSGAQIISTASTRDTLGLPRTISATQMPAAPLAASDPVVAAGLTSSAAHMAAPDTAAPAPLAPRDFEALIDRLTQARETAQPGAARVSLPHSEFGQVNLRFDAGAGAGAASMTVTMTSRDPDFALAARTALAERAALAPDPVRSDANAGRSDSGSGANAQAQGQGQGQAHGQTQNQAQGQMHGQTRPASNGPGHDAEPGPGTGPEHPENGQANQQSARNRSRYA